MLKGSFVPYFDHNATTPLTPGAREAWLHASDQAWQNPSSPYRDAARVRVWLEQARGQLALLTGCAANRVVFNSGATEGANAVFADWAQALPAGCRVAVNPTEHPCVIEAARQFLPADPLLRLEIDADGRVRLDRLEALLAAGAIGAIAVIAANNETGVLPLWREIAARCRRHRAFYLCDASQWLGKEEPSFVLAAMGFAADEARRVIRISAGWETREADWSRLAAALAAIAAELPMASSPDVIQL